MLLLSFSCDQSLPTVRTICISAGCRSLTLSHYSIRSSSQCTRIDHSVHEWSHHGRTPSRVLRTTSSTSSGKVRDRTAAECETLVAPLAAHRTVPNSTGLSFARARLRSLHRAPACSYIIELLCSAILEFLLNVPNCVQHANIEHFVSTSASTYFRITTASCVQDSYSRCRLLRQFEDVRCRRPSWKTIASDTVKDWKALKWESFIFKSKHPHPRPISAI